MDPVTVSSARCTASNDGVVSTLGGRRDGPAFSFADATAALRSSAVGNTRYVPNLRYFS
jgi:hypothetical protein